MFIDFFLKLREACVPVSLREYLTLVKAVEAGLANFDVHDFYYLSRATMVKDERNLDKFDQVFGEVFKGIESTEEEIQEIPEEWLRKLAEKVLTEEEKKQIEALGGWEKLMETLKQRLEEQKKRHQGAPNGLVQLGPRRLALTATIRKGCALVRRKTEISRLLRFGTRESSKT